MEYLESGSLTDKIKNHNNSPLYNDSVLKYLVQILEGVEFLHQNKIYHSDIKPANILYTAEANLKICDFGILTQLDNASSSSDYYLKGDSHYMSPERLNGASRSAPNDIWAIGATFVEMICGHPLNHLNIVHTQLILNISQNNILIEGIPKDDFLKTLPSDFRKEIISTTLCKVEERAK